MTKNSNDENFDSLNLKSSVLYNESKRRQREKEVRKEKRIEWKKEGRKEGGQTERIKETIDISYMKGYEELWRSRYTERARSRERVW